MKKIFSTIIAFSLLCLSTIGVSAREINMYVRNYNVVRDVVDLYGFDMIPIADIAGELGYEYYSDGNTFRLVNYVGEYRSYTFTIGDAAVYDQNGGWHGLDVVPQYISGKVRIPSKFLQDTLGLSYVWDAVTDTIFIGSENIYNWLVNTAEYKEAANRKTAPAKSPVSSSSTYECYPGTSFRTFTSAIGQSVKSSSKTGTGSTIYEYGYTSLDSVYSYMSILQSDGITYNGTEEQGTTTIISFWGENNALLLIAYDTSTGTVKILVS